MLICSTDKLSKFCAELLHCGPESVAVDTEFSRSFSEYYPRLCLLQLAYEGGHCVVDALAEGIDLEPLQDVFANKKIFKVFHDCRQDLDALSVKFPSIPDPIFDTQIAAMLCEYHENSVGYSKLVEQFLGVRLNKLSFKRVDWSKRPLTEGKVRYALDDVVYLHKLYEILKDILEAKGRLSWYLQEMENIGNSVAEQYISILEGMDFYGELTEEELMVARSVVEWREKVASLRNVNRNIVMCSKSVLNATRDFISSGSDACLANHVKGEYLRELSFGLTEIVDRNKNSRLEPSNAASQDRDVLSVLSILLHNVCLKHGVSQRLVASRRDLVRAMSRLPSVIMRGWRYEFFGNKIEDFVSGKSQLVFSVSDEGSGPQLLVDTQLLENK
ncbi:ribonuclease D [Candidatus Anaplasma sp. TIGMIC]|uniref:ribonuclease D n=1 Tax=Candidatus Anaplasma sp. TIGMIC TaxID=3020713 RepID=UPI00232B4C99|nr:ribonuclease D [Candidatus Anaplasma sp. TIGMIC]MDB1135126.1 ribonuclease D [Candidatus Anaplasma sp. TIGMIC]